MTITQLQQAINRLETQKGWLNSADQKMTFLTEELGEVAKWVRKARMEELNAQEREALNSEIADVSQHLISLANHFKLDIEQGLIEKKGL